ncbi:MAG TPA: hypothetical protein VJ044_20020, partial [Candidatus Hodarchaeales archaeon]|nr:hypothetical protein [Candidatus Hodarchaeales archaeon]
VIHRFFEERREKALLLISGDLAHTHLPENPYNFAPEAIVFDESVEQWLKSADSSLLLRNAAEINHKALSCGFTGLVVAQGILESRKRSLRLLVRRHPTCFGMMCAFLS